MKIKHVYVVYGPPSPNVAYSRIYSNNLSWYHFLGLAHWQAWHASNSTWIVNIYSVQLVDCSNTFDNYIKWRDIL